jgi:hypothetical protein
MILISLGFRNEVRAQKNKSMRFQLNVRGSSEQTRVHARCPWVLRGITFQHWANEIKAKQTKSCSPLLANPKQRHDIRARFDELHSACGYDDRAGSQDAAAIAPAKPAGKALCLFWKIVQRKPERLKAATQVFCAHQII